MAQGGAAQDWSMLEHPPSGKERSKQPETVKKQHQITPQATIDIITATRTKPRPQALNREAKEKDESATLDGDECDKWTDCGEELDTIDTYNTM